MLAGGPANKCPRCQEDNAPGTKFCGACGARLSTSCPACGTFNPAGQKFCGECGAALGRAAEPKFGPPESYTPRHLAEKILSYRSSLEGERKQVTVLFADVKSSLELLADRDPEDARKLLDAVLARMMEAVHRYEGTVNQVMGDGVMAIFGAPLAHEDHAVRACYAALRIQRRIARYADRIRRKEGLSVQVRVGLNSGEVVVRSIGNDLHMDYTAVGQTTHLAGRMEQIAAPGSILITADTLRLAEGYVQVKSLGNVPVRGLASSIEVFEVIGAGPVRSRLQAAAARGLTRFVGRTTEMAALREALEAASAGQMQVVAVAGEAGVGKSRLLHEFIHSSHTRGWLVLESNSVSYGKATPYLPVIDFLKHYFKIDVQDDTRTIREKVTGKILMLDESLQDAIPPMFDLLEALPDEHVFRTLEPLQRRQQTVRAVTRLMLSESRIQPVVAMFEDLHWNDSLTLGLLKGMIANLANARLLLLVSYRPDFQDEWRTRPHYRQLRIEPLPRASVDELLDALVGSDSKLAALKEFLAERTGGNPFFLEEIVRTLVETRVLAGERGDYRLEKPFSSVQVPATVQAVLAARIDRLTPDEKRLLQEAAVIGTDVPFALLREITGLAEEELRKHLAGLQIGEFVYETRLFPDLEYTFKHALTHEVAYAGLLHTRRREIHARVVAAIETLYRDRLTEQVERLAHHAKQGEVWVKALVYLRQAGAKAVERPANREACALFEQALEALTHLPETRETLEQAIDLRFDIRNALQPLGDRPRILEFLRAAERLAVMINDKRRLGWVHSYLTDHFWITGRTDEAAASGERALEIARQLADVPMQVVTNLPLGLLYHTSGDYRRAMQYFEWNIDHLKGPLQQERFGLFVLPSSFSRSFQAWAHADLGEFSKGTAIAEEGVQIAVDAGHAFSSGYAHLGMGVLHLRQGDLTRAIFSLERALAMGAFAEIPVGYAYVAFHLGYALALAGRSNEGLPILEKTVEVAESKGFVARHALRLAYLAEAYLLAGRTEEASTAAARALQFAREHKERANEAYALRAIGEVESRRGKADDARSQLKAALNLAQELGMKPLVAHCHWSLARVLQDPSNKQTAATHRESASALFRSMAMQFWVQRLEADQAATT
jgi:class 3 adenylate cyclase/tetratricopeptide (TPR) repeat protein